MSRLDLYELDSREPIGHLDDEGVLCLPDGSQAGSRALTWPMILFADVPVILHLSAGYSIAPFHRASASTGPEKGIRSFFTEAQRARVDELVAENTRNGERHHIGAEISTDADGDHVVAFVQAGTLRAYVQPDGIFDGVHEVDR